MKVNWKVFFVCILFLTISINNLAADSNFFGYWENVNCNTRGITKFYLKKDNAPNTFRLHVYGSCHPTDCDWGNAPLYVYGAHVEDSNFQYATAVFETDFTVTILTLEYMDDKRILLNSYTRFSDNSNRKDYHSYDIFLRIDDGRNEPVSRCADLVVDRIHSLNRDKKTGNLIIKADIKNTGTAKSEQCTARCTDRSNKDKRGDFFFNTASVKPLKPDESVTVQFRIIYKTNKIKNIISIRVKVDINDEVEECDEDNNTKQYSR